MKPMLILNKYEIKEWNKRPVKEIAIEVNDLEREMKKAVGYTWANHHIRIAGGDGKPALTIQFYDRNPTSENTVDFWNARTGTSMDSFSGELWNPLWTKKIFEWLDKITQGFTQCNECKYWVKDFQRFSYAGAVCKDCYDSSVHQPPDSR